MLPSPRNRLRSLRLERGLTLDQISHATGLCLSTIHAAEIGQRDISALGPTSTTTGFPRITPSGAFRSLPSGHNFAVIRVIQDIEEFGAELNVEGFRNSGNAVVVEDGKVKIE